MNLLLKNKRLAFTVPRLTWSNLKYFTSNSGSGSSVDMKEVDSFSKIEDWWDSYGSMMPLHAYNYARVNYIKRIISEHSKKEIKNPALPFKGLNMLDVGCGGGILCESLARLGGNVTGIDATQNAIFIATEHAARDPSLKNKLSYINTSAEELSSQNKTFDVVTSVEVVEHVNDVSFFVKQLADLTQRDGLIFVSTINKTLKAYGLVVLAAEYLTRTVAMGTHDYNKFITPDQLTNEFKTHGFQVLDVRGFSYNPIWNTMEETDDLSVNYFVSAKKL